MSGPARAGAVAPVRAYEERFAEAVGARHAMAFACARHALAAILEAGGLRAGDEIVLSPLTCKVVPLALLSRGLRPVYADVAEGGLNLDPDAAEAAVGAATRALLFQHTYGHPGGGDVLAKRLAARDLLWVEDCAQVLPGAGPGARVASGAAIYSNNLMKPLPAASGGAAVCDDPGLAARIAAARDRLPAPGRLADARLRLATRVHETLLGTRTYWPLFTLSRRFGASYRQRPLDVEIEAEITATAGRISAWQARRGCDWLARAASLASHARRCCAGYAEALRGVAALELPLPDADRPLYYFPVLVPDKPALLERARRARLELVPWPLRAPIYPLERSEELGAYGYRAGSCPAAEDVARRLVGLPTHAGVDAAHRERVAALLRRHVDA